MSVADANQDAAGGARVWDPDGPTAGSLAPALWDTLRESVLWAEAEWERVIQDASGAEEATAHLAQLCRVIRQEVAGLPAETSAVPRNALSRRWLGLIRTAFLERARALPAPEPGQLLQILHALERVGVHLEADWAQHFTDRLSSPDGLELVVEVAHDLRSPLTSILFLAETLQRGRSGPVYRGPGAPARAHLQRRLRSQLSGERRHRAGPGRRPVGGPGSDSVLGHGHSGIGEGHRPTDRGGEKPHGSADRRRRPTSASVIRWR